MKVQETCFLAGEYERAEPFRLPAFFSDLLERVAFIYQAAAFTMREMQRYRRFRLNASRSNWRGWHR